jgi:hypothetical protein
MGSRTSGRRLAGADAARHKIVVCVVLVVMALYWFSWTLIDDSSWRLIKAPSLSRPPGRLVARRSNTDMTVDELKDVTLDLRRVTRELKRIRSSTAGDGATGACRVELASPPCESPRRQEQESFTAVYKKQVWGTTHGSHTRSGSGSTIRGAFDTIFELENFMQEHNITSIADVPSGDCGWQFSVASINAARCYFGGDIVKHVVEANAERYEAHSNKGELLWWPCPCSTASDADCFPHHTVFQFWDFVSCPIPRWRTTCDLTPRPFDMVLSRDVIQHLRLDSSLEAVRKVGVCRTAQCARVKSSIVTSFKHMHHRGRFIYPSTGPLSTFLE